MKKNKALEPLDNFESGKIDMRFDSVGLERINEMSSAWTYQPITGLLLAEKESIEVLSLCKHRVGDAVQCAGTDQRVVITEINLIRLDLITDEMALRSGVELISTGLWKHYAPEMFYPKSILKKADPNKTGFSTPKGSFFSRWCKESNDLMDIYSNPWIWQYLYVPESSRFTAVVNVDGKPRLSFSYTDLEKMSSYIFDKLLQYDEIRPVTVTSAQFGEVVWDYTLAHYCYAHGRLTESQLVRIMFLNEDAETVLSEGEQK